jgi:hypothetical protein
MARQPNTSTSGTTFTEGTIEAVWKKGASDPAYPGFRKDACGAWMQRAKYGKLEQFGWEIDHIKPVSKGGTDALDNLQPLLWRNNRHKGDSYPTWSCEVGGR